jgi:hypothetical protein
MGSRLSRKKATAEDEEPLVYDEEVMDEAIRQSERKRVQGTIKILKEKLALREAYIAQRGSSWDLYQEVVRLKREIRELQEDAS